MPSVVPTHPWAASLKHTVWGFGGPSSAAHVNPPSWVTTSVPPSRGISHPWIVCGSLPPAIPQPCRALTKWTERIGMSGSPSWCHERPASVVPSKVRGATAQPVVALTKSTPTNSSVEAYCFVQCAPSVVPKMACDPTAQPTRGPTIWIAASAGTKPGSTPDGVGVALAEADSEGVGAAVGDGVGGS